MKNAGREAWESEIEIKTYKTEFTTGQWKRLIELQRRQIDQLRAGELKSAFERQRREAWIARPCSRCGKTGTEKDHLRLESRPCAEIREIVTILEACGGVGQSVERLAEQLHQHDYEIVHPEDYRW